MATELKPTLALCLTLTAQATENSKKCISTFCKILGFPDNAINYLIGDDPHGVVDIQEGYRFFNMTDVHVLLANYKRWMELYGDHQTLRKVVDEWYYWTLKNHDPRKDEWISVEDMLPEQEVKDIDSVINLLSKEVYVAMNKWPYNEIAYYDHRNKKWYEAHGTLKTIEGVTHWMPIPPVDKPRYCNLKSWLMGWRPKPEDCLPYYNEQHAKDIAEAHARTQQAKQELNQEVEQFKQGRKF